MGTESGNWVDEDQNFKNSVECPVLSVTVYWDSLTPRSRCRFLVGTACASLHGDWKCCARLRCTVRIRTKCGRDFRWRTAHGYHNARPAFGRCPMRNFVESQARTLRAFLGDVCQQGTQDRSPPCPSCRRARVLLRFAGWFRGCWHLFLQWRGRRGAASGDQAARRLLTHILAVKLSRASAAPACSWCHLGV
jgi:hypothetical protein